jgi:hypothetical protein
MGATSQGGHIGVYNAVNAQLDPPLGKVLRPFQRLRRRRNAGEYPDFTAPALSIDDVREDARAAKEIIDMVRHVMPEMAPF